MSVQCERSQQCEKQQQEYEFVMEGITTRMQLALEKMSDSNRMMAENNKRMCGMVSLVCITMILSLLIMGAVFLIKDRLEMDNINQIRGSGVSASEAVLEQRPGAAD